MVARCATESAFQADVEQARKNFRSGCRPALTQAFGSAQRLCITMERCYKWLPTSEFEKVFGLAAKHIPQLDIVSMTDEWGTLQEGVIMVDESSPFRHVRVSWQAETELTKELLQPTALVRDEQAPEFAQWWNEAVQQAQPAPLHSKTKLASQPVSIEAMQAKVQEVKRQREEARLAEKQAATSGAAGKQQQQVQQQQPPPTEEEDGDATDTDEERPKAVLPELPGLPSKKGEKGRGKGSGRGGRATNSNNSRRAFQGADPVQAAARSSASLTRSAADQEGAETRAAERSRSPPVSMAPSVASGRASQSQTEKLRSQITKYISEADLSKIVSGQKCGNELQNLRRLVKATAEHPGAFAADNVQLKALLQLCEQAQQASVHVIHKLSSAERQSILAQLVPRMTVIPPQWAMNVYILQLRDMPMTTEREITAVVDALLPVDGGGAAWGLVG